MLRKLAGFVTIPRIIMFLLVLGWGPAFIAEAVRNARPDLDAAYVPQHYALQWIRVTAWFCFCSCPCAFLGRSAAREVGSAPTPVARVQYRALVIGNNRYTALPALKTAVDDATEVGRVLGDNYGFEIELLTNAKRSEILGALNRYRRNLAPESALVIYFAGHGYFDQATGKAYWLPCRCKAGRKHPVDQFRRHHRRRSCSAGYRHVLVISGQLLFRSA